MDKLATRWIMRRTLSDAGWREWLRHELTGWPVYPDIGIERKTLDELED